MPLHIGWRSLGDQLKALQPDVVGCGENHALYSKEALRFFQLVRDMVPNAKTVAGGGHFTNLWHRYMGRKKDGSLYPIDAVASARARSRSPISSTRGRAAKTISRRSTASCGGTAKRPCATARARSSTISIRCRSPRTT
jgi:hypothetical protein